MTRLIAGALRGARMRLPPGCRLVAKASPSSTGAGPTAVVFTPPKRDWRRRQLLAPDTAVLLDRLAKEDPEAVPIPGARVLARLILDGLLEVESPEGFVSGAAAHHLCFAERGRPPARGTIGRLSHRALVYAAALGPLPPARIAARLYRFNTRPFSPGWRRRLDDPAALRRFLRGEALARGGSPDRQIRDSTSGPWRAWHVTKRDATPASAVTWKLYVSPTPEGTARALRALHDHLGDRSGPFSMKVGQTLDGALRPDRIVAYFDTRDALHVTARTLRLELDGLEAQGVPFSASLGRDGLLSWGADLATMDHLPVLAMERSWRGWVTIRLATALTTGRNSGASDPVAFALDRLTLDGVSTATWAPTEGLLRSIRPEGASDGAD